MAYQKTTWTSQTPINESNLNKIENQLYNVAPPGEIRMFAGATAPEGFLICDGSAVSRETYGDLFNIIGTTYGEGDGSTTFNIPNLKGKVIVGLNSDDTSFNSLGKSGGSKSVSLAMNNLPWHKIGLLVAGGSDSPAGLNYSTGGGSWNSNFSEEIGTNQQPISVLQPYVTMNYIIKF